MGSRPTATAPGVCPNCGAPASGPWCANCGQESIAAGAFRRTLRRQWLRVHHALAALLIHPGLLTAEFRDGLRARSITPWRLTLNTVAFFFLLSFLTDFRVAHIAQQDRTGTLARTIQAVAARTQVAPALVAERIDHRFNAVYTLLLGLSVVWYAVLACATHWKQRRPFAVHTVFGLHYVAWIFAMSLAYFLVARVLSIDIIIDDDFAHPNLRGFALVGLVFLWAFFYLAIAFRRVYGDSHFAAAWKAALVLFAGAVVDNLVAALAFYATLRLAGA